MSIFSFYSRHWKSHYWKIKKLSNSWIIIFIGLISAFLIIDNFWAKTASLVLSLSVLILLFNYKRLLLLLILAFLMFIFYLVFYQHDKPNINLEGNYTIKQKLNIGFIVQEGDEKIFFCSNNNFSDGAIVKILGVAHKVENNSDFDLVRYLKTKGVFYQMKKAEIEFIKINNDWRDNFTNFISNGGTFYQKYLPLMILGKYSSNGKDLLNLTNGLGILHLFVISGFHITFLYKIWEKIALKFKIKPIIYFAFFIFIFIGYLFLVNFKISTLRAFIFLCLCFYNKRFLNSKFSNISLMSFSGFALFFWNFYLIYDRSLIYAFLILLSINLVNQMKFKNKNFKNFTVVFAPYFVAQLVTINFGNNINIFAFINIIILTPIVVISYMFAFCFFWQKEILEIYLLILDSVLLFFSAFSLILNLNFLNQELRLFCVFFIFSCLVYKAK